MTFYEHNLRARATTPEALDAEELTLRLLLAGPGSDQQKTALGQRLAIVRRLIEELTQTTLPLS